MYGFIKIKEKKGNSFDLLRVEQIKSITYTEFDDGEYTISIFHGAGYGEYYMKFKDKQKAQEYLQSLFEDIAKENGYNTELNKKIVNEIADVDIGQLDFSIRTYNTLRKAGVRTIGDLSKLTKEQLKDMRNMGSMSLGEVLQKLEEIHIDKEIKKIDEIKKMDKIKEYLFEKGERDE